MFSSVTNFSKSFSSLSYLALIAARWRYGEAEFLRIAVYSDPGRGGRRGDGSGRDLPDYVTLRCEGLHALAAAGLREGDRLRAAGQLTSREYDIPLTAFLKKARGDGGVLEALRGQAAQHGDEVAMPHSKIKEGIANILKAELRRQGITPGLVKPKPKPLFGKAGSVITPKDIAFFSRQMATMMKSGVPLL